MLWFLIFNFFKEIRKRKHRQNSEISFFHTGAYLNTAVNLTSSFNQSSNISSSYYFVDRALMEGASASENSQHSALTTGNVDPLTVDPSHDGTICLQNHKETEPKLNIMFDEAMSILEVIATTGKFWHDWDMLKSLLSSRLKQVLSEYPEAKVSCTDGPQPSTLSEETYTELVQRLNGALLSFVEGPPFTLQRLCEILLAPKSIYRTLSKLALALEKNLLVTSTVTKCTDPYPKHASATSAESDNQVPNNSESYSASVTNGVETGAIIDEEMIEAEADACGSDIDNKSSIQTIDTEVCSDDQNASAEAATVNKDAAAKKTEAVVNDDTEMQEGNANNDALESNHEPNSDSDSNAKVEQTTETSTTNAEENHPPITQQ